MKEVTLISPVEREKLQPLALDDFSRFKEKVIMINTLKGLFAQTDKATLKMIARNEGEIMSVKTLRNALKTIIDQAIKRAEQ